MKKIFSIIIFVAMLCASYAFATCTGFTGGGSGTVGDPYEIDTCTELQQLDGNVDCLDDYYELTGSFSCSGTAFNPIGFTTSNFTGSFDGNDYTISDLNITSQIYSGLFANLAPGVVVRDLTLSNVYIYNATQAGALAARSYPGSEVINCHSSGYINESENELQQLDGNVGGLIGWSESTVLDSSSSANVRGDNTGGLVGTSYGSINNCSATGTIYAYGGDTGGLVGLMIDAVVNNSFATGNIIDTDEYGTWTVGGLVGEMTYSLSGPGSIVQNSYATGSFNSPIGGSAGGLVGDMSAGKIISCNATGDISVDYGAGGLVGETSSGATIEDSHAEGTIYAYDTAGGLVGYNLDCSISNSYATGAVSADMSSGGLIGYAEEYEVDVIISASYATGAVDGRATIGGLIGATLTGIDVIGYHAEAGIDVTGCHAEGTVEGEDNIGGLIGYADADNIITSSYATGAVTGTGGENGNVGGLIGDSFATIQDSYATGAVSNVMSNTGGLVGFQEAGDITRCYATGDVSGEGNSIGGLVGYQEANIDKCYATGSVTGGEYSYYVGGLVGTAGWNNPVFITNSYATGNIVAGDESVGGLVGLLHFDSEISDCFASGSVTGGDKVGGLVGGSYSNSYITNSSASGPVILGHSNYGGYEGGLLGSDGGTTLTNSYWDICRTLQDYCTGAGNSTSGCTGVNGDGSQTTYLYTTTNMPMSSWDFVNIWDDANSGTAYPILLDPAGTPDTNPDPCEGGPGGDPEIPEFSPTTIILAIIVIGLGMTLIVVHKKKK